MNFTGQYTLEETVERGCVATIGFFDGVHCGHRFLLRQVVGKAAELGLPSVVVSFSNHPASVLRPELRPLLLTSSAEKVGLLRSAGADCVALIDFTPDISHMSARDFMQEFLLKTLNVKVLLMGYDHHFGSDRLKGFHEYEKIAHKIGLHIERAHECLVDGVPVSSSRIRKLMAAAQIDQVNRLLGYTYSVSGVVEHGNAIGTTLGFPTANIRLNSAKQLPASGVYSVVALVNGVEYRALANIGTNPTVGNDHLSLEVHLLDFQGDLYDQSLVIAFHRFLRHEQKFASLSDLQHQIQRDIESL